MDEAVPHFIVYALGRITRSSESPSWKYIDNADLAIWQKAVSLLHSRNYTHDECQARVTADWRPALSHVEKHAETNHIYHEVIARGESIDKVFSGLLESEDKVKVEVKVEIWGENEFRKYSWYPKFFAEKYIYDFFCIMNLANPGSCDFFNLHHISSEKYSNGRIHLSSYNFEEALFEALEEQSPYAKEIDIEKVLYWYNSLGLGTKQIAEIPIEKTIFSMLHFCKADGDVASVIWIFHALESIYSTRVGEGFTNLVSRISLLLKLDDKERKRMSKKLRALYDHRSSLVHGGYKIHSPMTWSTVDPRINEVLDNNYRLLQFGFNLILASVQALIRNGWYGVTIVEELTGIEGHNK